MDKSVATAESAPQTEQKRTAGLKLFDVFLYPVFTNISVFIISVAATYLTSRGGERNAAGELVYGKIGEFFHKRGEWLMEKFKGLGMSHKQADMSKMVFFSFLDGSLMAPFIKLFEDRREKIGRAIDKKLGNEPADPAIYEAEPKHSWLSVLGGRFVTAGIVAPTAKLMDMTGMNDKLFNEPGEKFGGWLAKKPSVTKLFGKLDVKELSRIGFFELFYTTVCTIGLYFTSRHIAKLTHGPKAHTPMAPIAPAPVAPIEEPTIEQQRSFVQAVEAQRAQPQETMLHAAH